MGKMHFKWVKNNLSTYRSKHSISQENLAKDLGVTRQTIYNIESYNYLPSLDLAYKIAKYFNVKIEDIFWFGNDNEKSNF